MHRQGPTDSAITIVGGGAVGAAAAYFLAKAGYQDIQLIEAGDPASATTSQAAGLLGQSRTTSERTRLTMESAAFYRRMEEEVGVTADWRETGSIRIAMSQAAEAELRQIADVAEQADLVVELVDARRVQELCPVLENVDEVRLALWCPTDGYIQPNSLTSAYLHGARRLGVRVVTHTAARDVRLTDGRVSGLVTDKGDVATEMIVNAAGPWAGALARRAGLELPVVPVLHEYFVTDEQTGWHNGLPCLRIPEIQVYARGEGSGILCGGFESSGTSLNPSEVDIGAQLSREPNWPVLESFAVGFSKFAPAVESAGIQSVFHGWPGFTPDGRFLVGPVQGLPGFVMAAGFNAHGVSGSAGLAQHLVESLSGDPSPWVASLSPDRFVPRDWDWEAARRAAQAICENYYPMPQIDEHP